MDENRKKQRLDRYPGLWPFRPEQANIFYGRDREKEELFYLSRSSQVVLLFSKSGVGKSSLLNAGIIPRLQQEGYLPISVLFTKIKDQPESILASPLTILKSLLRSYTGKQDILFDKESPRLWEYVKTIEFAKSSSLVLVFDQFEELFNYSPEEVKEFLLQIAELIHDKPPSRIIKWLLKIDTDDRTSADLAWASQPPVKFIFAIRGDRLSELQKVDEIIPGVFSNRYQLLPMDVENAKLAITNPAKDETPDCFICEPFTYEKDVLTKIIDKLKSKYTGEIEPTQLQILCRDIEDRVKASHSDKDSSKTAVREITTEVFDPDKEIDKVLHNYYEQQLQQVGNAEEIILCRHLLENDLLEKNNENYIRIRLSEGKVKDSLGPNSNNLLKKLLDSRLIKSEIDETGIAYYQISHDSLKDPILESKKLTDEKEKIEKERISQLEEAKKYIDEHYECRKNNEPEKAVELLKKAEKIYENNKDEQGVIDARIKYAKILVSMMGKATIALKILNDIFISINPEKGDNKLMGLVKEDLGIIYSSLGRKEHAHASFEEALAYFETVKDYPLIARMSEHIGELKEDMISSDSSKNEINNVLIKQCKEYYEKALKAYSLNNDAFGYQRVKRCMDKLQSVEASAKPWGFLTDLFTGQIYTLQGNKPMRIGRDVYDEATKTFTLKNEIGFPRGFNFMSRRHASITPDLIIEDTQSLNGTTINNTPLYYGNPRTLADGDIIVLANVKPLRFTVAKPVNKEESKNSWAIFIDGGVKKTYYLTRSIQLYSLVMREKSGESSSHFYEFFLLEGDTEEALLKFRMNENVTEFFAAEKTEKDISQLTNKNIRAIWEIRTTVKDADRIYKDYILHMGNWTPPIDFPMQPELTIYSENESKMPTILAYGPTFQVIINHEFNEDLAAAPREN